MLTASIRIRKEDKAGGVPVGRKEAAQEDGLKAIADIIRESQSGKERAKETTICPVKPKI